jgi:hypothetical protein
MKRAAPDSDKQEAIVSSSSSSSSSCSQKSSPPKKSLFVICPGHKWEIVKAPKPELLLDKLQALVGGNIESIPCVPMMPDEPMTKFYAFVNAEGANYELPENQLGPLVLEQLKFPVDALIQNRGFFRGPVVIMLDSEDGEEPLTAPIASALDELCNMLERGDMEIPEGETMPSILLP